MAKEPSLKGTSRRPTGRMSKKKIDKAKARLLDNLLRQKANIAGNLRTGGFVGIETKYVDQTKAETSFVASNAGGELDPATNNCLNAVAQGTTQNQRDGQSYHIKSVNVRGSIYRKSTADATAAWNYTTGWIALVLDTQSNGAQLNSEDVYTSVGLPSQSFRNLQYAPRFRVLKYFEFNFDSPNMSFDGTNIERGGQVVPFNFYVKNLNIPVRCTDTGATVADIQDNSLHIIGAASDTSPYISYESRVRFVG